MSHVCGLARAKDLRQKFMISNHDTGINFSFRFHSFSCSAAFDTKMRDKIKINYTLTSMKKSFCFKNIYLFFCNCFEERLKFIVHNFSLNDNNFLVFGRYTGKKYLNIPLALTVSSLNVLLWLFTQIHS